MIFRTAHQRKATTHIHSFSDLSSPAHPQTTPLLDCPPSLPFNLLHDLRDLLRRLRRGCRALKESSQLLALLLGIRWVPRVVGRLAVEEIRNKDLILVVLVVRVGQDVSALQRLRAEAEDVVYDQDGGSSGRGASFVCALGQRANGG